MAVRHPAPAVLIHGALTDARVWAPQEGSLGRERPVIAAALSGFHPSPFDPDRFSADRHVEEIIALLEGLGRAAHLVGHSRGGRLALHVAARMGDRLASLTLMEPGGVREPDFLAVEPPAAASTAGALEALAQGDSETALRLYIDTGHGEGAWRAAPPLLKDAARANVATLTAMATDGTAPLSRAAVRAIRAPTLLMGGSASAPIFGLTLDALAGMMPQAERRTVQGAAHFLPMTHAEAVDAILMDFMARAERRRGETEA